MAARRGRQALVAQTQAGAALGEGGNFKTDLAKEGGDGQFATVERQGQWEGNGGEEVAAENLKVFIWQNMDFDTGLGIRKPGAIFDARGKLDGQRRALGEGDVALTTFGGFAQSEVEAVEGNGRVREERGEEVLCVAKTTGTEVAPCGRRAKERGVVSGALGGNGEGGMSFGGSFEFSLGGRVGVQVGVVFAREAAPSDLDLRGSGGAVNSEEVIVIGGCHGVIVPENSALYAGHQGEKMR